MKTSLIICLSALALYVFVTVFYGIRIKKAEKNLPDGSSVKKPTSSFWSVFIVSVLCILLPLVIPLETYLIALVAACGVLGAYLVLKDRLELINKSIEQESPTVEFPPENE